MNSRILIVEDNADLAEVLSDNLAFEGFQVERVDTGEAALRKAEEFFPDLVVLDIMLPDLDGFEVCRALRQRQQTAILMLTSRSRRDDRIRGLNIGADDYITKPFHLEELIARIRAVLRRTRPGLDRLTLGPVVVDFRTLQAKRGDAVVDLSHVEFELLQYLASRPGTVVHRDELLANVWRYPSAPLTRLVDQAIARLRRKVEDDPHHPRFIHTVHGSGYCLTPDGIWPVKS
jgi:DNA-binding response OmpR family regulator